MSSITGLKPLRGTSLQNTGQIYLGDTIDAGTAGEAIISAGPNVGATWGIPVGHIANALTAGTNVSLTSGNPSWDGSIADTINSTDTDTTYSAGNGIDLTGTTFSTDNDGTTINNSGAGNTNQVLKVPTDLTINGTVYNGSVARNFTLATSDTTYQGGDNITIDTTTTPDTIDLDKTLTDMTSIVFNNTGTSTSIIGSTYYMNPRTPCTYLDLSSNTNLILPPNVYDVAGSYHMAFNQGIFQPNDDSSYYNYAIEDDFTSPLVAGRGKIQTSTLELEGFLNIPNGWRATGILIDLRGSTGFKVSRTITMYEVKTWSSANPIASTYGLLGSSTTNTQYTFSTSMDGAIDNCMWIEVSMTSTSDYIAGGYVILTKL